MMSQYTLQPLNCKLSLFLLHSCPLLFSLRLILFVICSLLQFGTVDCSREMISKPSKPTGSDQPSPHTPIANPWTSIVRTQPEEVIIVKPRGVDDRMRRERVAWKWPTKAQFGEIMFLLLLLPLSLAYELLQSGHGWQLPT